MMYYCKKITVKKYTDKKNAKRKSVSKKINRSLQKKKVEHVYIGCNKSWDYSNVARNISMVEKLKNTH